jgi:Tol biopolymer transport system component
VRGVFLLTGVVLVVSASWVAPANASSSDTGTIAFVREVDQQGVWLVRPDGTETRITHGQDYRPNWSPDGRWIVFQRFDGGGSDIYLARANGSDLHAITTDGDNYHPSWSPDGTRIAFGHGSLREGEIEVMDADGFNRVQLTQNRELDARPTWSPDGSTLCVYRGPGHTSDLWLVPVDGSAETRLTRTSARDQEPSWSPDGLWIVFSRSRANHAQDLYLIHPDGSGLRRLTHNLALDWSPSWSPDGSQVVFTRARYPRQQELLVAFTVRTGARERVAVSPAFELEPDWRPA